MNSKLLLCSAAIGLIAVSCIDDKYDLENVDTTSRVEVKDLVVPVNFDELYLSTIISLDDNSDLKIVEIDGTRYYALSRKGDFDSDNINVKQPEAKAPTLESKKAVLESSNGVFNIPGMGNDFTFYCDDVDKAIVEIASAQVAPLDFTVEFKTPGLSTGTYNNVRMQLPKGMTGKATNGQYDGATGIWTVTNLAVSNGYAKAVYTATSIDFTKNDFVLKNQKFDFTSNFSIIEGELAGNAQSVDFSADFTLSNLDVIAFSGKIEYQIEGLDISPINLGDLPSFLQGDGTDITLANPMICLQTTNPVAGDKLNFSASLSMKANRETGSTGPFDSDVFTVGHNYGENGPYNTILSPKTPENNLIPQNFKTNYTWAQFASLGSILAGKGLPKSIDVTVKNPMIPLQSVTNFVLGRDITGVVGSYELFAPFAMTEGSLIHYSDIEDGWSDDFEDMTITSLTIDATATNNTMLDAQLTIYPIDKTGNRIPNVELTSTLLPADAVNAPVKFVLTGTVTGLDGVEFVADVKSKGSEILSPDQGILFQNIRAKVNGYYQREL